MKDAPEYARSFSKKGKGSRYLETQAARRDPNRRGLIGAARTKRGEDTRKEVEARRAAAQAPGVGGGYMPPSAPVSPSGASGPVGGPSSGIVGDTPISVMEMLEQSQQKYMPKPSAGIAGGPVRPVVPETTFGGAVSGAADAIGGGLIDMITPDAETPGISGFGAGAGISPEGGGVAGISGEGPISVEAPEAPTFQNTKDLINDILVREPGITKEQIRDILYSKYGPNSIKYYSLIEDAMSYGGTGVQKSGIGPQAPRTSGFMGQ